MDAEEYIAVVKETHLSQKPSARSASVAAMSLAAITVISLIYWLNIGGLAWQLPASGDRVLEHHEYWRLLTTMFVHADIQHLLANALGFGALSYLLYGYFGFAVYPCLSFGCGVIVTLISLATYPSRTYLLGVSGVIYFMAAFWLALYMFLERRLSIGKRFLRATGFVMIMLVPTTFNPGTSYRTHALGFAAGIISGIVYFSPNKDRFRRAEVVEWE